MNAGFKDAQGLLDSMASAESAKAASADNALTQKFLDRLAGFTSVDQVNAFRGSAEANALHEQLSSDSKAKVRGGFDARVAQLQQQATAAQQTTTNKQAFDLSQLRESQRGIVDKHAELVANGDFEAARALREGNRSLVDLGAMANHATLAERAWLEQGQRDQEVALKLSDHKFRQEMQPLEKERTVLGIDALKQAAADVKKREALLEGQRAAEVLQSRISGMERDMNDKGNAYREGVWSPSRARELTQILVSNGIGENPEQRQKLVKMFSDMGDGYTKETTDPVTGKVTKEKQTIPFSVVVASALGANNKLFNFGWNDGYAKSAKENFINAMEQADVRKLSPSELSEAKTQYDARVGEVAKSVEFRKPPQMSDAEYKQVLANRVALKLKAAGLEAPTLTGSQKRGKIADDLSMYQRLIDARLEAAGTPVSKAPHMQLR